MSKSQSKAPQAPEQSLENNSPELENKDFLQNEGNESNNPDPEIPDMDAPAPSNVGPTLPKEGEVGDGEKDDIQLLPQTPLAPEQSLENNSPEQGNMNIDPEYLEALMKAEQENSAPSNGAGIFHGNRDVDRKYPLDYDPEDNVVVRIALIASSGGQVSEVPNSASIQVFEPSVYDHLKDTGAFKGKAVLILND